MLSTSPTRMWPTQPSQSLDTTGPAAAMPVATKDGFKSFTFRMEQIGRSEQSPPAKPFPTTTEADTSCIEVGLDRDTPPSQAVQSTDPCLLEPTCIDIAFPSLAPTPFGHNSCVEVMASHSSISNPSPVEPATESPGEDDGSCILPPEEEVTEPSPGRMCVGLLADLHRGYTVDLRIPR